MNCLITGRNGQLAREFIKQCTIRSIPVVAPEESALDITSRDAVHDAVEAYKPDVIINCAGYNLVDRAEAEQGKANAVNANGPKNLAMAAAKHRSFLVHFGSDYVFDGMKENGLYTEEDAVHPLNVYGSTKLAGEQHVIDSTDRYLVLRLSWVFGSGTQNFIYKLREWASSNAYLKIACDEFSVPTYTGTVVDMTLSALAQGLTGRYHLTSTGFCSRYEWAKMILSTLGITKFIRPVPMDTFNLPARRPKFSAMDPSRLAHVLGRSIPAWEDAVRSFLRDGALTDETR